MYICMCACIIHSHVYVCMYTCVFVCSVSYVAQISCLAIPWWKKHSKAFLSVTDAKVGCGYSLRSGTIRTELDYSRSIRR